jgi:hypothetical protein
LNLQLYYDSGTPARKTLDVWPALPLLIGGGVSNTLVDNVITVLEHSDRICKIDLLFHTTWQIEKTLDSNAGAIPGARNSGRVI